MENNNIIINVPPGSKVKVVEQDSSPKIITVKDLNLRDCFMRKNGTFIYRAIYSPETSKLVGVNTKGNHNIFKFGDEVYKVPLSEYVKSFIDELTNP